MFTNTETKNRKIFLHKFSTSQFPLLHYTKHILPLLKYITRNISESTKTPLQLAVNSIPQQIFQASNNHLSPPAV